MVEVSTKTTSLNTYYLQLLNFSHAFYNSLAINI